MYKILSLFFVVQLLSVCYLYSDTPSIIKYQGVLRERGVLVDAEKTMKFRITNADGTKEYWSSGDVKVRIVQGAFSYEFEPKGIDWGKGGPYYLEITVDGQVLLPREKITSVVYAFYALQARSVDDDAITTPKIKAGAVTTDKIATGAVTEEKIAGGAVSNVKISNVSWSKLTDIPDGFADGIDHTAAIGTDSVGSYHIIDSTITSVDIKDGTIIDADISPAANIAWTKIDKTGSSLADLTIRDAGVLTGMLSDERLSGNVTKLGPTIGPGELESGDYFNDVKVSSAIYAYSAGSVVLGAGSVGSYHIIDSTITTTDLQDGAVTDAKLSTGISASKIGTGTVDNAEFGHLDGVTSSIQSQLDAKQSADPDLDDLADGLLTSTKVGPGALRPDVIASSLAVNAVHTDAIQAGAVTTAKIGDREVSSRKLLVTSTHTYIDTWYDAPDTVVFTTIEGMTGSLTVDVAPATIFVFGSFTHNACGTATGRRRWEGELRVGTTRVGYSVIHSDSTDADDKNLTHTMVGAFRVETPGTYSVDMRYRQAAGSATAGFWIGPRSLVAYWVGSP